MLQNILCTKDTKTAGLWSSLGPRSTANIVKAEWPLLKTIVMDHAGSQDMDFYLHLLAIFDHYS